MKSRKILLAVNLTLKRGIQDHPGKIKEVVIFMCFCISDVWLCASPSCALESMELFEGKAIAHELSLKAQGAEQLKLQYAPGDVLCVSYVLQIAVFQISAILSIYDCNLEAMTILACNGTQPIKPTMTQVHLGHS